MDKFKENLIEQINKYSKNKVIDLQISNNQFGSQINSIINEVSGLYTISKNNILTVTDDSTKLGPNVSIIIAPKEFNFNNFFINTTFENIDTITWAQDGIDFEFYLIVVFN